MVCLKYIWEDIALANPKGKIVDIERKRTRRAQVIKIAVVEDEEWTRTEVCRSLERETAGAEDVQIDVFYTAEEFLDARDFYEVIISDIKLPGISGLELGEREKEKHPDVYLVFLTSYSEFAAESYLIEAYQYILKQNMDERLLPVMRRILVEIRKSKREFLWIGTGQNGRKIYYKDIILIQKLKGSKYSEIVTAEGDFKERLSLNEILRELHNDMFIMTDRGHVVNIDHIQQLKDNTIYMTRGDEIAISRSKTVRVKEQITAYWRGKR